MGSSPSRPVACRMSTPPPTPTAPWRPSSRGRSLSRPGTGGFVLLPIVETTGSSSACPPTNTKPPRYTSAARSSSVLPRASITDHTEVKRAVDAARATIAAPPGLPRKKWKDFSVADCIVSRVSQRTTPLGRPGPRKTMPSRVARRTYNPNAFAAQWQRHQDAELAMLKEEEMKRHGR